MDDAERLKKRIRELEKALQKEKQKYDKLEKEYQEFKAKHTQTVSELRKALKIKEDKVASEKPVGAQKGH